MKRIAYWIACACMVCPIARGAVDFQKHPYVGIFTNNAFRLRPIQIEQLEKPSPPLPKVSLVGIITVLPHKRALFKVVYPTNGHSTIKEQSFILSEGQRDGPLEVVSIDDLNATVQIKNSGTLMLLTFETEAFTR